MSVWETALDTKNKEDSVWSAGLALEAPPANLKDPEEIKKQSYDIMQLAQEQSLSLEEVEQNYDELNAWQRNELFDPSEPPPKQLTGYEYKPDAHIDLQSQEYNKFINQKKVEFVQEYFNIDPKSGYFRKEIDVYPETPDPDSPPQEEHEPTLQDTIVSLPNEDINYIAGVIAISPQMFPDELEELVNHEYRVRVMMEQLTAHSEATQTAIISGLTFTNVFNLAEWTSRKGIHPIEVITGKKQAQTNAIEAAARVQAIKNEIDPVNVSRIANIGAGVLRTALEFWMTPGASLTKVPAVIRPFVATGVKFATREAMTLPRKGETPVSKGLSITESFMFGMGIGSAHKYIPKAQYRVPAVTGALASLTYATTGDVESGIETGVTVLGFEAVGLMQQAMQFTRGRLRNIYADKAIKAARKHNPELYKFKNKEVSEILEKMARNLSDHTGRDISHQKARDEVRAARQAKKQGDPTKWNNLFKKYQAVDAPSVRQKAAKTPEKVPKAKAPAKPIPGPPQAEPAVVSRKPVQVGGKKYHPISLPTESIGVDAKRFQFKLGAKLVGGVTEALKDVEKFDPVKGGQILVWQDNSGKNWVVDGHHRVALAKKTGTETMETWVIREQDGWNEAEARAIGALRNLADGKGTAVDAAKLFRDSDISMEQLRKEGVPTNNQIVQQGMDMKALSDHVFRLVIDERLPANMAAAIGKNIKNAASQKQAANLILEGEVDTLREAELLAATIDAAPVLTKQEQTLFGVETTEKTLYAERAKILANVERKLKTNKKVFGTLAKQTGLIEEKGNILAKQANIETKEIAEEVLFMLEKLAKAKGPVAEALNDATKKYAENPTRENLGKITEDLLRQWTQGPTKLRIPDSTGVSGLFAKGAGPKEVAPAEPKQPPKGKVTKIKEETKRLLGEDHKTTFEDLKQKTENYDPKTSVHKLGNKWYYLSVLGNATPGLHDTKKAAVEAATFHYNIYKEKIEDPEGFLSLSSQYKLSEFRKEAPKGTEAQVEKKDTARMSDSERHTYEAEQEAKKLLPIKINASDIDYEKAVRANSGIHMIPENSAYINQRDYLHTMINTHNELAPLAKTEAQKAILKEELERFKQGYLKRYDAVLNARSRVVSSFIAGPSNFPVKKMNKRADIEHKRVGEMLDWEKKAVASIKKKLKGQAIEDAGGPIVIMEKKLAEAEKLQDFMKKANVIVHKKIPDPEKAKLITEQLNVSEATARNILQPDYMGKKGFARYQFTNNLANIKRMKQRLSEMKSASEKSGESTIQEYEGVEVVNNFDVERVQLLFDEKPSEEVRKDLRGSGWRWSPKATAWQRKNTDAAIRSAKTLLDKHYKTIKQSKEVPKGKEGFIDVAPLAKAHQVFMNIIEPSKAVEIKHGKEVYAEVIKGVHKADVARIEFTEQEIETIAGSLNDFAELLAKYPKDVLTKLMISRGKPESKEAIAIQNNALKDLVKDHPELVGTRKMITRIFDFNHEYLRKVAGEDVSYIDDYHFGIYKDPAKVERWNKHYKTTKKFLKQKTFPTFADAYAYGMRFRDPNPVHNAMSEYIAIARLDGMIEMRDALLKSGKGQYIDTYGEAPMEWVAVPDPVFKGLAVEPDLGRMINSLISTNKITRQPILNTIRQINNFLRTLKFAGSAFHLGVEAKQSLADSGYLGFLHKKTALSGLTTGFKKGDPIFKTPEYREYVGFGGGHRYSIASEAQRGFSNAIGKIKKFGPVVKGAALPVTIPEHFVRWMFENYIPKVKYAKYLDTVNEQIKKLGRPLTKGEKIDIIKEGQNFYGMMNERLFGRSGTVTTLLRFKFMAPGFAEGNIRTMLKAALQWNKDFSAHRSRSNIVNSFIVTAMAATIGTLIFTGKQPETPETLKDVRDLFKIDTGHKDSKGHKIMIDLLTYDRDYWNVFGNIATGQPEKAVKETWRRLGGMTATTWEVISDLNQMSIGNGIYDWKGDRITEITDPFLQRIMKLSIHELSKVEPISMNVFKQARKKDLGITLSALVALAGIRMTKSEADKREIEVLSRIFSLRDQQERLYYYLGTLKEPREKIKNYNNTVMRILTSSITPLEIRDEYEPKLIIDIDRLISNRIYGYYGDQARLADLSKKPEKHQKDIKETVEGQRKDEQWLKNFEIDKTEHRKYLVKYETLHRKLIKEIRPEDNQEDLKEPLARMYAKHTELIRKSRTRDLSDTEKRTLRKHRVIIDNVADIAKRIYETEDLTKRHRYYERIRTAIKRIEE
jgi:hypothetical protein